MKTTKTPTTVYLDSQIHSALKFKAADSNRTISELVNEAVKLLLADDADDLAAFEERAYEPDLLFEDVQRDLK